MESIKNLPNLISALEREKQRIMAIEDITDALKALESAKNAPAELDRQITEKQNELDSIAAEVLKAQKELHILRESIKNVKAEAEWVKKDADSEIQDAKRKSKDTLKEIDKQTATAIKVKESEKDAEIKRIDNLLATERQEADRAIKEYQAKIDAAKQESEDIEKKLSALRATFGRVRMTLGVEEE